MQSNAKYVEPPAVVEWLTVICVACAAQTLVASCGTTANSEGSPQPSQLEILEGCEGDFEELQMTVIHLQACDSDADCTRVNLDGTARLPGELCCAVPVVRGGEDGVRDALAAYADAGCAPSVRECNSCGLTDPPKCIERRCQWIP
jgi:hypothetical protein